ETAGELHRIGAAVGGNSAVAGWMRATAESKSAVAGSMRRAPGGIPPLVDRCGMCLVEFRDCWMDVRDFLIEFRNCWIDAGDWLREYRRRRVAAADALIEFPRCCIRQRRCWIELRSFPGCIGALLGTFRTLSDRIPPLLDRCGGLRDRFPPPTDRCGQTPDR